MQLTRQLPWESPDSFQEKPEGEHEYGYLGKDGKLYGCETRGELIKRCSETSLLGNAPVRLVWTPETPRLVAPEEVPFLFEAIKQRERDAAQTNIVWSTLFLLLFSPLLLLADSVRTLQLLLLFYLLPFAVALAASIRAFGKARRLTAEGVAGQASASRYAAWLRRHKLTYTRWLMGALVMVMVVELFDQQTAIEAAGLIKSAVRRGEVWRLLTCSTLHANFQHLWFNLLALHGLGRLVEAHANRWHLALVFLFAVLSGSLFSLVLLPDTTSVGASGGLMGLIGFLAVVGYRRRAFLPPSFLKLILLDIALVGAVGLLGFAVIDNAAHLGGLVSGALAGLLLVRGDTPSVNLIPDKFTAYAGNVAMVSLLATAAASTLLILSRRAAG